MVFLFIITSAIQFLVVQAALRRLQIVNTFFDKHKGRRKLSPGRFV
jgi:hypothetical protein